MPLCSSHTPKTVGVDTLSLKHTHFALMLLTQWYDNLCADSHTRTHKLCNGVEFYGSTQNFANTAFWFALRQNPSPPPLPPALSLTLHSSHPIVSRLFITFCCHFWLRLPFIPFVLLPCSLYSVLIHFQHRFSSSPSFTPHSPSTSTCPSMSSPFQIFYFHHLFFCALYLLHSSFSPKCLCVVNILFD